MTDQQILEKARKVVADLLKVPEAKVTPGAHFVKDLGMESVQSIELVAAFEEEFDIEIEQEEVAEIFTLDKAARWLARVIEEQSA